MRRSHQVHCARPEKPAAVRPSAIQVERHEEADLEPIEVDPLLFTQVLVNLLVNAAEATAGIKRCICSSLAVDARMRRVGFGALAS
jgi:signal transduction histidine kinase